MNKGRTQEMTTFIIVWTNGPVPFVHPLSRPLSSRLHHPYNGKQDYADLPPAWSCFLLGRLQLLVLSCWWFH